MASEKCESCLCNLGIRCEPYACIHKVPNPDLMAVLQWESVLHD